MFQNIYIFKIFTFQFWRRIPFWTRILPFLVYMGVVIWAYSWIKDREGRTWVRMNEVRHCYMYCHCTVGVGHFSSEISQLKITICWEK